MEHIYPVVLNTSSNTPSGLLLIRSCYQLSTKPLLIRYKQAVFGIGCLVLLVTKRDRWESTPQGGVMCEHYWQRVLMYTPGMRVFTTENRCEIEQED